MDPKQLWNKISSNWRLLLILIVPAIMLCTLAVMLLPDSAHVAGGRADLSGIDFRSNQLVPLDGEWEFYWNKLLTPEEFRSGQEPKMDSFMKVPGVWANKGNAGTRYPRQGTATYRLLLTCPLNLKDPALRIQFVANAYKLYVNGQLMEEVGGALDDRVNFKGDDKIAIIDLPKDTRRLELVFQVGNLNYAAGGLRAAPVFGSKQVLGRQSVIMLILQLLFLGGVFLFGVHYFFLFLLQTKNKTALLFAVFCLVTVLRSLILGEIPLQILFPDVSPELRMYINYSTGYNYVAIVILFVYSIYPLEFRKKGMALFLLPSLAFDVFLLLAGPRRMTFYTNYLYVLLLLQMLYIMAVLMKSVLRKRENAVILFIAICTLVWTMNGDIINYVVIGNIYITCMFLVGNFAVILAMSYVQARQQAMNHKKLLMYNERLLEADKLKDRIMATEMSFLQAQIKPHFLYNALSAIANVSEKDGKQAGKLIIDLAIYLRGSLEFNNLNKMATIEKELEFVDTYFHIEQARFGQKIQLKKEVEIPLEVQIPVLVLQPLVENAVRHGISKKPGGGTVTVRMTQKEEDICIAIEDDGVGITGEKLEALLDGTGLNQGVGLLNIHNRLLKLYGRGLEISSEAGCTRVRLWIPEAL